MPNVTVVTGLGISTEEIIFLVLALAGFVLWVAAIVDWTRNCPDRSRLTWILVLVFLNWIGALAYYAYHYAYRRQRP